MCHHTSFYRTGPDLAKITANAPCRTGGGPWGYADFLGAISNPRHEQHEELLEWVGRAFEPEEFDVKRVNREMRSVRGRL